MSMHILWVKTELLHPIDKGGRIRTYQMLRSLLRNHSVTYLCLDDGTSPPGAHELSKEYCTTLITVPFRPAPKRTFAYAFDLFRNLFSPLPYAVSRYHSEQQRRQVLELSARADIVVCDFLAPSQNVPDTVRTTKVLFQHNVESVIWQRRTGLATNPLLRAYFHRQWQRMRQFEKNECQRFDRVIAVSEADARSFTEQYGIQAVSPIPTGVDVDYFADCLSRTEDSRELLFIGSMDWMPNEDGIRWFAEEVFGLVRSQNPESSLSVVGRSPSTALVRFAERTKGVNVMGTVPDVRPYLKRAAVSIVPLRIGGGTRIKVFEAMAAGVPVVSTSIGAEGLPVTNGEHLLLADDPRTFSDALTLLLRDRTYAQTLARNALQFVREHCSWQAVTAQFLSECQIAVSTCNSDIGAVA